MYDYPFTSLTMTDLLYQIREMPVEHRTSATCWLFGWMQGDVTDKARAEALNAYLAGTGAVVLTPASEPPADGDSPLAP